MDLFKKQPDNNWLINLDQYLIKEKPEGKWDHKGPWYSDDGEDGVLNYLFEYINDKHKFAVDIGSAHGYGGSQIRHLVDKYDWKSTEIDGGKWNRMHPRIKREWIKPDNICELLDKYETPKEFDLLSLDIDSMDWYVLEKLLEGDFKPSVAIIEFNPIFEHNEEYVVNFNENYKKDGTSRYGASAKAYETLMNKYNYTLVHVFPRGVNNLLFISNKFISPTTNVNIIEDMHPVSYVERHKKKWNKRRKLNKEILIRNVFEKLKL
jgi:hypothetical protein